MLMEIRHRETQEVLFSQEATTFKPVIEAAVSAQAHLRGADLREADLAWANLRGAHLAGVKNAASMILPTGETLAVFRKQVVPALLAAGGHLVPEAAWQCHDWQNCPMACAFRVRRLEDIPPLYRPRVEPFVYLYDQGLIHQPI